VLYPARSGSADLKASRESQDEFVTRRYWEACAVDEAKRVNLSFEAITVPCLEPAIAAR